ncbi:bifunctional indole-3-glycerol-phosphate synthase TrpC/phosphoribosylanthranilate isomerase TrpF [Glaciecola sp. SC05]|uniref:bifunctional indole-3-glycerol-phosphate synthase TrpC/phosphoribosylanthranilate isomerase TrpF n=1 Tax=Glaciecola sp. SC05 TaxID=1987355 RepID=UPI00352712B8
MADVLGTIVADKRIEIAQREIDFPLAQFQSALEPSRKSFIEALNKSKAGFIFECKKASPSKGLIRENFDLDEIVTAYEKEAACFSVLTDEKYFQGRFEYLSYVTGRVTQPVLNKDFFVVPYQIYLARYYNADAVLLMLSVLTDAEYQSLAEITFSLGMEVLTEVSNEAETHRALALGAKIIGINNRDLRDLSTNLATTERLVPIIRATDFNGVIISESGIYTHQDLQRLNHLVDGYLVGSSLMAQDNLDAAIHRLVYGEVKICGITEISAAIAIAKTQASYMGLIFAPNSPRFVSLEQAVSIIEQAPFNYVGVFVDAPLTQVVEFANRLTLHAVQLHGNEHLDYISALRSSLPEYCQIWKVQAVTKDDTAASIHHQMLAFADASAHIDRWLFDCKVGQQSGGTGEQFDWQILNEICNKSSDESFDGSFHQNDKQGIFGEIVAVLAGGIDENNAASAIKTRAQCIDVNSGVETAPGIKDLAKIQAMFTSLRI